MKVLLSNVGSSSRRYSLFEAGVQLESAHLEKKGQEFSATYGIPRSNPATIPSDAFLSGPGFFLDYLLRRKAIAGTGEIEGIGVRVVCPGKHFQNHKRLDDAYFHELEAAHSDAPLHIGPIIREVGMLRARFASTPMIGVSDSAFHASLPRVSRNYALPLEDSLEWGLQRYGYHGISATSILRKLRQRPEGIQSRIILCHLGSGCSAMAIHNGKSVDVSMGFSPLEGLVMGTRVGDMDPAAVIRLIRKSDMDADRIEQYLNTRCGLAGLSGASSDMRDLLDLEKAGNDRASLAVESFVYRIRKYLGAYAAALDGLDQVIFTGAIGEHSPSIRQRICEGMEWLGIHLDQNLNASRHSGDGIITSPDSKVQGWVSATEEMREMGEITVETLARG